VLGELTRWTRDRRPAPPRTTQRRPLEVSPPWSKPALRALPTQPYVPTVWQEATVHPDAHVCVGRALYSVPWRLIGEHVLVRDTPTALAIYAADARVATHPRVPAGQRSTQEEHLPPERRDLRHRSRTYWEARADRSQERRLHPTSPADDVLAQLRTVQQIVRHLERFQLLAPGPARAPASTAASLPGAEGDLAAPTQRSLAPTERPASSLLRGLPAIPPARAPQEARHIPWSGSSVLKKLRLSGVLQSLDLRVRQAADDPLAPSEFLYRLLTDEVERREAKQLDVRLRRASFEHAKTIEDFDFTFNPTILKAKLLKLATCAFIARRENVCLVGQTGVGKSHLAPQAAAGGGRNQPC
jgi:hypothetical protein